METKKQLLIKKSIDYVMLEVRSRNNLDKKSLIWLTKVKARRSKLRLKLF